MDIQERIQSTHDMLAGVSVPIALLQQIGLPIMQAMEQLREIKEEIRKEQEGQHGRDNYAE